MTTDPAAAIIVIPSRYGSTRLPGKALVDLAGKPLIQHVYERASAVRNAHGVYVATDDQRIVDACAGFGAPAIMTPVDCASGSDRVACACAQLPGELIVNVQGDEPLLLPQAIEALIDAMQAAPDIPLGTLAVRLTDPAALYEPDVVKVVTDLAGNALYFSRAPVPYPRDAGDMSAPVRKHIGIYAYRREALQRFVSWAPTPLEQTEKLEQLRALEHGMPIRVVETAYDSIGVDTPADAERVRQLLSEK